MENTRRCSSTTISKLGNNNFEDNRAKEIEIAQLTENLKMAKKDNEIKLLKKELKDIKMIELEAENKKLKEREESFLNFLDDASRRLKLCQEFLYNNPYAKSDNLIQLKGQIEKKLIQMRNI